LPREAPAPRVTMVATSFTGATRRRMRPLRVWIASTAWSIPAPPGLASHEAEEQVGQEEGGRERERQRQPAREVDRQIQAGEEQRGRSPDHGTDAGAEDAPLEEAREEGGLLEEGVPQAAWDGGAHAPTLQRAGRGRRQLSSPGDTTAPPSRVSRGGRAGPPRRGSPGRA
jgi:hypothetical protein